MGTTTNNKLLLWLTLIKCHICTFCQLRKFNYVTFITKRLKLFLKLNVSFGIPSYLPFPVSTSDISDIKKHKLHCEWAWEIKKMVNYHLKGLYRTTCYKTKPNFSQFFFSRWLMYKCFFSCLINVLVIFWKIDKILSIKLEKIKNTDRNILPKTYNF